jgi:hypothetical protein
MCGGLRGGGGPGGGANAGPQGDLSEIRTIIQVFEEMWASGYRVAMFPDVDPHIVLLAHSDDSYPSVGELPLFPLARRGRSTDFGPCFRRFIAFI